MATLIVTPFTPRTTNGRGLRTVGLTRALSRCDDVEVAYVEFDGREPAASLVDEPRVRLRRLDRTPRPGRILAYGRARRAGVPAGFARGVSPELVACLRDTGTYDRVVADGPIAAAAGILLARSRSIIYNAHNVESSFRTALSGHHTYGSTAQLERFERALFDEAVETWLPTERDVGVARGLAPAARLRRVPNVVDVAAIRPVERPGASRALFVADLTYEPNLNAARFLVGEVMPRLWRVTPTATLSIVGRGSEALERTDDRVATFGFVDRLEDAYRSADCAVVPLLEGGGSPLKLIEALAYGLPVVATTIAVRGIDGAVAGTNVVVADDAASLADALRVTLEGGNDHVAVAGRALAEEAYSIDSLVRILSDRHLENG